MKIKVSDYIAGRLAEEGVQQVFTVTGGGAMHLNDSLGHHPGLRCLYHHHEQAAAMAAEAYARVDNQMAAVCVTSGPGATNAITGALCAWMDSLPMLVMSGQVRYDTTVRSTGLKLRTMGVQEYDIIPSVAPMTKYAVMVTEPTEIGYHLDRALYLARTGRPGPCWLDLPLNVQSAVIETDQLKRYDPAEDADQLPQPIADETIDTILKKIKEAKRPLLFAGHGIRLAGAFKEFKTLVSLLGIPVVTGMSSIDLMAYDDPLFVGRNGGTGDRAGNFAVQTCDVYLSLGSRQSFLQTGFNYQLWAKDAYTILNDIDGDELKKPSLHVDLPVVGDVKELMEKMIAKLQVCGCTPEHPFCGRKETALQSVDTEKSDNNEEKREYQEIWKYQAEWREACLTWKQKYPVVTDERYKPLESGRTNIYAFYDTLSRILPENEQVVVSVGTSRVAGSQAIRLDDTQRFYTNAVTASMGYGLPAAIGVSTAATGKEIVLVNGEGCMQMNLQELQTIVYHRMPIRIFVIDNEGYHSIRQTQNAYFHGNLVGVGEESRDLSFPDPEKLAAAYGFAYGECCDSSTLEADLMKIMALPTPCICRVAVSKLQNTEPKLASRQLPDGTMVSASLDDMAPFLPGEERDKILAIKDL